MTGCRVKSVTLKSTGRKIEVIPRKDRTKVAQELINNVFRVLNNHSNPKAYILVVLDEDGSYSVDYDAKNFPFGAATFLALVKDLMDRDVNTNNEIRWFCKQQGWIDNY